LRGPGARSRLPLRTLRYRPSDDLLKPVALHLPATKSLNAPSEGGAEPAQIVGRRRPLIALAADRATGQDAAVRQ
jgi:hypothetical protein